MNRELVVLVAPPPSIRAASSRLASHGHLVEIVADLDEALEQLERNSRAILVAPRRLDPSGQVWTRVGETWPAADIILVAPESEGSPLAVLAEEAGTDCLVENADPEMLLARVQRACRHRDRRLELERLRHRIERERGFESMLGTSHQMRGLFELLDQAAGTRASVLITGESGTGKELVARALHQRSPRSEQAFVAINCSAVPEHLLESELFGHVRGAFTDARESRAGLFVKANGGSLFLDEIGDMPSSLQPKLLRALQERTVRPVGGDTEVAVDVRVIAATNRDLEVAVTEGDFREDLYYRLNVIHVEVPPLRERSTDILLLAEAFARGYAADLGKDVDGIARPAAQVLLRYGWPGNVRELQNCMERAVALCRDEEIGVADLPPKVRMTPDDTRVELIERGPTSVDELVPLDVVERRYIERVLEVVGGNRKTAARILGIDRKTLYRKLDRYRLADAPDSSEAGRPEADGDEEAPFLADVARSGDPQDP